MYKVKNVCFTYPDNEKVIDNLSFEINKGDFVVICGESGCGKTTLLRLLKSSLQPTGTLARSPFHIFRCLQHLMSQPLNAAALCRQLDCMVNPLKQRHPQFLLQLPDLKGYGGLRVPQPFCGFRKASQFCHLNKAFQIFQFHIHSHLFY